MKKLILICVLFCSLCVLNSFSQTEKGTYLLGGGFSTSFIFYEGSNSLVVYLTPGIGYFLSNNFVLGGNLFTIFAVDEDSKVLTYDIAPFVRYYFGQGSKTKYFVTGALGLGGSTWFDDNSSGISITGNTGVGGVYFLNKSIGLETTLKYEYSKRDISEPYSSSSIMLGFGFQIYFSR